MNESKSTETKKKVSRKVTKRQRNLRNTIMMAGLSVVLLSGATYAWFTLSNTAKITNLSIKAAESSGLLIAPTNDNHTGGEATYQPGTYGVQLNLTMTNQNATLLPANLLQKDSTWKVCQPIYSEGIVTELEPASQYLSDDDVAGSNAVEGYYYEKSFYLKVEAEGTYAISLTKGSLENNSRGGTYVVDKEKETSEMATNYLAAADCVRISFSTVDVREDKKGLENELLKAVYEPNCNVSANPGVMAETAANLQVGDYKNLTLQQSNAGEYATESGYKNSNELFQIQGNTDQRVIMRVWIEGEDPQCGNGVSLDSIVGQIQFESKKVQSP